MNDARYDPQGDDEDYTYEPVANPLVRIVQLEAEVERLRALLQTAQAPVVAAAAPAAPMLGVLASRIYKLPNGEFEAMDCALIYNKPVSINTAIERVMQGRTAFVLREDAAKVLAALQPVAIA